MKPNSPISLQEASVMTHEGRIAVMSFLEELEEKYQVESWELEGVQIWPLLKRMTFFRKRREQSPVSLPKPSLAQRGINKLKRLAKANYWTALLKLRTKKWEKVDFVFSGNFNHRVIWKESAFNRYFDPIMDFLEQEKREKSIFFEYGPKNDASYYNAERIVFLADLLPYFKMYHKQKTFSITQYQELQVCLADIENTLGLPIGDLQTRLGTTLNKILMWKSLWVDLLQRLQPKGVLGLCYYNAAMYGFNLAADELGIPSVDMQHGGQGPLHAAYHFKSFPAGGYNLLPNYFWCWDQASARNIETWTGDSPRHQVILGGNPWIDHQKEMNTATDFFPENKRIILFTLQTGVSPFLPPFLIEAIKNSSAEYAWWLRLHPRMKPTEVIEIRQVLELEGITDRVEVDQATQMPLPLILSHCFAHLSHSSGSIGEAAMVGVPRNVIIGGIGQSTYQHLIDEGKASYFDQEKQEDFWEFLNTVKPLNGLRETDEALTDYRNAWRQIF